MSEYPSDWNQCLLGERVQFQYGKSPSEVRCPGGQYPIYGSSGKSTEAIDFTTDSPSIIVGRKGTIDKPIYLEERCWAIDTTFFVDQFPLDDPKYLFYLLDSINLKSLNESTGVPSLSRDALHSISVSLPPLPEQKKITETLSGIDREIAVLVKKKRKLEKTLTAYLSAAIQSDCEFIELQELCKVTDGAHKTPTYVTSGVPFLRVTDIKTGNLNPSSFKYIPEEEHLELIKRCRPEKGDILLSKNGTIGVPRLIDWDWDFSIFVSLALLKIKDRKRLCPEFCELLLKSPLLVSQIFATSKQGTVTNLHLEEIRKFKVHLPPYEEQQEIIGEYQALCRLISACSSLVEKKKFLRTAITSDLLSGRKRVSV